MKRIFVLVNLIAFGGGLFAKSVDQNTAQSVAYNFYKTVGTVQHSDDLGLVYKASSQINGSEVAAFYVFNNNASKGFVIVSADDNVKPVLAYSTTSSFRAENIPSNVQYWLSGYQQSIAYAIQHNVSATEAAQQWTELLQPATSHIAAKITNSSVGPLVQSVWDQGQYYDSLCPYDNIHHARSITGCVATAMAQVMRYWQWPDTGRGSSSYMPYSVGTMQSVNFSQSVYHWDSMAFPMNRYLQNPNMFVAKLMYDAGVSVDMDYNSTQSGSYVLSSISPVQNCAEYALKTYFRYKPSITGVHRYDYSDAQWIALLQNELDSSRPVIYQGQGQQGGHCFVCDGYNSSSYFSFNWGWSGYYNGYYTVNALTPGTEDFTSSQAALINIIPDTPVSHPSGIEQLAGNSDIEVYPNPANDVVTISSGNTAIQQVYVTDVAGHLLISQAAAQQQSLISLDLHNVAAGVYFIQLNTNKGVKTEKIIVTK